MEPLSDNSPLGRRKDVDRSKRKNDCISRGQEAPFWFSALSLALFVVAVTFKTAALALVIVARVWQRDYVNGLQGFENVKRYIS